MDCGNLAAIVFAKSFANYVLGKRNKSLYKIKEIKQEKLQKYKCSKNK